MEYEKQGEVEKQVANQPKPALQDRKPKKPTKAQAAELERAQSLLAEEKERQEQFVAEYNALCGKYGYYLVPQMTMALSKKAKQQ